MLKHPLVTVLRSFNNSETVNECSRNFADALEKMKMERIELRMNLIKNAFSESTEIAKNINEQKTNSINELKTNISKISGHLEEKLAQQRITSA